MIIASIPATWRNVALNLALVIGSLVLCGIVLELVVRFIVGIKTDRPIIVEDTQDAFSFIPGRTGTYETSEYRFVVEINRHGRRDNEWTAETIADPRNILFIGDSFVFGMGVADEATLPTLLEASYTASGEPREVFNFGMPGADPPQYKGLLRQALQMGIQAETVVLGIFVGNDFYPNVLDPQPQSSVETEEDEELRAGSYLLTFLVHRISRSPQLVGWVLTLGRWLGIDLYDSASASIFLREQPPGQRLLFRQILEVIGETKRIAEANERDMYWVIIPNKIQVENRDALTSAIYDAARPNRLILKYCQEQAIPCLDLLPPLSSAYEQNGKPLYFSIDRHFNPQGSRLAAQAIASFLGQYEEPVGRTPH